MLFRLQDVQDGAVYLSILPQAMFPKFIKGTSLGIVL